MSSGEAKRSTSHPFFGDNSRNKRSDTEQVSKRTRLEVEAIDVPSINVTSEDQTTPSGSRDSNVDAAAIKLNRLTEKCCRYKSHKDFLLKCKAANQIPNGLQLSLEPSIGNQDEYFLKQWYEKLDECSIIFIDMVADFCDKTISSLDEQKTQVKEELNIALQKEEYKEVIDIINCNEKETTQSLQQRKSKKFNYLRYHKGRRHGQPSQDTEQTRDKPSYADAARPRQYRERNPSRKTSFTNFRGRRNLTPKTSNSNLSIKDKLQNPHWKNQRSSPKPQLDERNDENYLRQQVAHLTKELEKVKCGSNKNESNHNNVKNNNHNNNK